MCRYVYQKAYVEFFCSPESFSKLQSRLQGRKTLTYMAVNAAGDVKSNVAHNQVNAVTWGVFPAKEVVQPTVVDPQSFSVWKVYPLFLLGFLLLCLASKWLLINCCSLPSALLFSLSKSAVRQRPWKHHYDVQIGYHHTGACGTKSSSA